MPTKLQVNDEVHELDCDPQMPLLWALRDELRLTGTRYGCGVAQCGACTVHVDGQPVRSCSIAVGALEFGKVVTIEGVEGAEARAVLDSWIALGVPQCGYCQSGQIMAAIALLREVAQPDDATIDAAMSGNICRCATYDRIRRAIRAASRALAGGIAEGKTP